MTKIEIEHRFSYTDACEADPAIEALFTLTEAIHQLIEGAGGVCRRCAWRYVIYPGVCARIGKHRQSNPHGAGELEVWLHTSAAYDMVCNVLQTRLLDAVRPSAGFNYGCPQCDVERRDAATRPVAQQWPAMFASPHSPLYPLAGKAAR